MRRKRLKLSGVILFGLGLTGLQAQTMYVKEKSGTQAAYSLHSMRKVTFAGGKATVQKNDNSTGIYALSGLRYLNFKDLTTSLTEPTVTLGNSNLITYPNPVNDVLNIDLTGVEGEGVFSILTLEGKEIQRQSTSGNSQITINLRHLTQGFYLCRYSNADGNKTVKIIKQ